MNFKEKRPLYILEEIASILRGENGCAWDKKQTSKTLKSYLIEEAYEVYDAIEKENKDHLKEELGDLLFQVYSHAQIAKENNQFSMDDIAKTAAEKLIRRHPHVFGNENISDPNEIIDRWEKIKKSEKSDNESILDGVPQHLPALLMAYRVQQKVSRIGFDWEKAEDAVKKLDEEISEFKQAVSSSNKENITEEAGDIIFSIVNALRLMNINPEEALKRTVEKFIKRFKYIEKKVKMQEKKIEELHITELDCLWEEAKKS